MEIKLKIIHVYLTGINLGILFAICVIIDFIIINFISIEPYLEIPK